MGHEHQLVGSNHAGALTPNNGFNRPLHGSLSDHGCLEQMINVPGNDVPSTNTSQAMVGSADALKHSVNRFW
jgi:hypothetical protein